MRLILHICTVLAVIPAWADPIPLGRYEVNVHLVLPHIDTKDYDFVTEICLGNVVGLASLGPLSPGPLSQCPRKSETLNGEWMIHVRCPGGNAAVATGTYRSTPSGFRGRVEMNMGGKNMTLAEEQRGRYLGPCE
ncbi:MAG: DUF3617 domain-containing protein [Paracoccaceae bacterium]